MNELSNLKIKLKKAEHKIRILEDMIENHTRELYLINQENLELEKQNSEIEQFAYVASHDLQEPLRTVTSFAELLKEEYSAILDANAIRYFKYITESCCRMSNLIKGLLDYARIGSNQQRTIINCNKLIKSIQNDLRKFIDESKAVIRVEKLPRVIGFETELRQLFQNLINNAIKFRSKDRSPFITISAKKNEFGWIFSIKDNGIGIRKKHMAKIFVIFQRLNDRNDYEGTGIGLAHCKKIVELHKGKIWVGSVPGKGSTFNFTIPG